MPSNSSKNKDKKDSNLNQGYPQSNSNPKFNLIPKSFYSNIPSNCNSNKGPLNSNLKKFK